MKTRLNRLFALLMALMMMFSMIPASSLATEGDGTSDASGQASNSQRMASKRGAGATPGSSSGYSATLTFDQTGGTLPNTYIVFSGSVTIEDGDHPFIYYAPVDTSLSPQTVTPPTTLIKGETDGFLCDCDASANSFMIDLTYNLITQKTVSIVHGEQVTLDNYSDIKVQNGATVGDYTLSSNDSDNSFVFTYSPALRSSGSNVVINYFEEDGKTPSTPVITDNYYLVYYAWDNGPLYYATFNSNGTLSEFTDKNGSTSQSVPTDPVLNWQIVKRDSLPTSISTQGFLYDNQGTLVDTVGVYKMTLPTSVEDGGFQINAVKQKAYTVEVTRPDGSTEDIISINSGAKNYYVVATTTIDGNIHYFKSGKLSFGSENKAIVNITKFQYLTNSQDYEPYNDSMALTVNLVSSTNDEFISTNQNTVMK